MRKLARPTILLLALLALLGLSATPAHAETEPNDGFGSENLIAINSTMLGDNVGGSSDYFKIQNPAAKNIKIDITVTTENPGDDQVSFYILDGGNEDVHSGTLGSSSGPVSLTITPATATFSMLPINMSSFTLVVNFPAQQDVGSVSYKIDVTDPDAAAAAANAAAKSKLSRSIKKLKGKIKKASGAKAKKLKKKLKKLKKQLKAL